MKNSFIHAAKTALYLLLVTGLFAACSNSTGSDDDDHHSEPEGFVLKLNGQNVVTQLPGGTVTGEFELEPGDETALITIFFLDEDGDEFQPDEPEFTLGAEFEDDGIAEFEQHSEDGKWSFHIHAEAEGITEMTLMLMHNGHSDFDTQGIHVHVETETAASSN